MTNALVTGAAGFIGLHLVSELVKRNLKVYAFIEKTDFAGRDKLQKISNCITVFDDLNDLLECAAKLPTFDCIYHLATVGVNPAFKDIELFCDVNIKMVCQLIDFAKKNHSKLLVNFGSCFEYGDHGDMLLTEDMECRPESLYAISKNASTKLATCYAKNLGVNLITVRLFGVFGEGEGETRLTPSIIQSCLRNERIKTTSGNQIRDFVDVKDVVKAVIALTEANYSQYEIYNICANNPVKVKDFILEIIETCKLDRSLIDFGGIPYRDNEAMVFSGSNAKLQRVIQYPFPTEHRSGILDVYNSLRKADALVT